MASEEYVDQYGRRFSFEHCVDILHELPKFDAMVGNTSAYEEDFFEGNGDPASVHDTTVECGSYCKGDIMN
jgi:hypothetical protein